VLAHLRRPLRLVPHENVALAFAQVHVTNERIVVEVACCTTTQHG